MAAGRELVVIFGEMLIDFVPTVAGVWQAEAPAFLKPPVGAPTKVAAVAVSRLDDDESARMLDAILRHNGVVFDSGEFARMLAAFLHDNNGFVLLVFTYVGNEFARMLAVILRDNNGFVFDSGARTALAFVGNEFARMLAAILHDNNGFVFYSGALTAPAYIGNLGDDEFARMLVAILRDNNGFVFYSGALTAPAYIGNLGDDEFARMLAVILRDNNGFVFDSGARTALAFVGNEFARMLAAILHDDNGFVFYSGALIAPAYIGNLGDDEFACMLVAILRDNGVVFDSGARTMLTLRADGEREFMFCRNTSAAADELNIELIETDQRKLIVAHENQDLEEAINTDETMESCRRAYKWRMPQILQVIYADNNATAGQLKEQKKRWSNYATKALFFAITMFSASVYQNQSTPPAFTLEYTLFLVCIFVSIVMAATLIILLPSWGNALVITSCLLLEVASCLVTLSFNGHYALTILAVLFLILFVALLQSKLQHALEIFGLPSSIKGGDTEKDTEDEENQYLEHLFDLAQGIANCGGLVTAIFGHYMVGPVTAAGFFFFCSISLGLYIMMVITVRAVSRPHVTYLAIVTVSIPFARHPERNPQVVKHSNHRKTLDLGL